MCQGAQACVPANTQFLKMQIKYKIYIFKNYVYGCLLHARGGGQKRASDLELELPTGVSCHVVCWALNPGPLEKQPVLFTPATNKNFNIGTTHVHSCS